MTKGQNNHIDPSKRPLGLPKAHILSGRNNFKALFEGRVTVCSQAFLTLRFRLLPSQFKDFKIGFVAPKRIGHAVARNQIKRWMREAYRQHQYIITDAVQEVETGFHGILMAKKAGLSYKIAEQEVIYLLQKAKMRLHTTQKP